MSSCEYQIETPTPALVGEALRLVFSDLSEKDRVAEIQEHLDALRDADQLANQRENRGQQKILLGCYTGDRLLGAALAQIEKGRTAVVWPPRLVADQPRQIADELLDAVCRQLARQPVSMANVLLEDVDAADEATLRRAGFEQLATLLYMFASQDDFPAARSARPQPVEQLAFVPYTPANHRRFVGVVEQTYKDTLDCPRLNGVRDIEDVLEGYRETGGFDPEHWLMVRHRETDVGCLFLADHPQHDSMELVYMGIVPSARGRGRGKQIARHAQHLTAAQGRSRLVLAVDARNRPALDMYRETGFRVWEKRIAYAKFFD